MRVDLLRCAVSVDTDLFKLLFLRFMRNMSPRTGPAEQEDEKRVIVRLKKEGMEREQKNKRKGHIIISLLMTGLPVCEGHLIRGCPGSLLAF